MKVKYKNVFYNLYKVSSDGYVYNKKGKKLNPGIFTGGYYGITLCRGKLRKSVTIHSLVTKAFLGKRPNNKQVNHKDGNKLNNNIKNLEYISPKENIQHARRLGLSQYASYTKLNSKQIRQIRKLKLKGIAQYKIAFKYNVTPRTIGYVIQRVTWGHVV